MAGTRRFLLSTILFLVLLSVPGRAQKEISVQKVRSTVKVLNELLPEKPTTVSNKELVALMKSAQDRVEKFSKRKFKKTPVLEMVNRVTLTRLIRVERIALLERMFPKMATNKLDRNATVTAEMLAPCILVHYGLDDGKIYVVPSNLDSLVSMGGLNPEDAVDVWELVMVSELTHALQDQEMGIMRRINKVSGFDRIDAYNAVLKGHAALARGHAAKQMKVTKKIEKLADAVSRGEPPRLDASLNTLRIAQTDPERRLCNYGIDFLVKAYQLGKIDAVWRAVKSPPVSMKGLTDPGAAVATAAAKLGKLAVATQGVEDSLGEPGDWTRARDVSLTPQLMRNNLRAMERSRLRQFLDNIAEAHQFFLHSKNAKEGQLVAITVYQLHFGDEGPAILAALNKMVLQNFEAGKIEFETARVEGFTEKTAVCYSYKANDERGQLTEFRILRAVKSDFVFEALTVNESLEDAVLLKAFDAVIDRAAAKP